MSVADIHKIPPNRRFGSYPAMQALTLALLQHVPPKRFPLLSQRLQSPCTGVTFLDSR
jgi:hypothetical protein